MLITMEAAPTSSNSGGKRDRITAVEGSRITRSRHKKDPSTIVATGDVVEATGRATESQHHWFHQWSTSSAAASPTGGWKAPQIWSEVSSYYLM